MSNMKIRKKYHHPYARINWQKAAVLFQQHSNTNFSQDKYATAKQVLLLLAAAGAVGLIFAFPAAGIAIGR